MKKIKITIDQVGKPKIEAEGFAGVGCLAATKPLIDAFDSGSNIKVEHTSEMFMCSQEEHETEMEGI